jgi:gliding motility-associated-like protein
MDLCATMPLTLRSALAVLAALPFATLPLIGQVPTKCFEIERILVDACNPIDLCPGSTEGQNEMVGFRVGPDPIALAEIAVQWPNNNWLGFAQNPLTAQLTAALNATIEGCGFLLEPPGGVLPPGARALLVTSTAMCTAGNSFANLADTLYLLFQNSGNTAGHFANHNNGVEVVPQPVGGPSLRTLIMTHLITLCGDTATYDRQLLTNIYGTYGGLAPENDGATAVFSWPGVPVVTYVNNGCLAPYEPLLVSIAPVQADLCAGGSVSLQGLVSGSFVSTQWFGGTGSFGDATAANTTYSVGAGDTGEVLLSFCAIGDCGVPVCASVTLVVGEAAEVSIVGDLAPCTGSATELTATGTGTFQWNTGSSAPTIAVVASGTYTVTASNACGSASASVEVLFQDPPEVMLDGNFTLCPVAQVGATGADTYVWSTGATGPATTIGQPGTYAVTGTNACGSVTVAFAVVDNPVVAAFVPSVVEGTAPLTVDLSNQSQPLDASFSWDFGDGAGSTAFAPTYTYTAPGDYTVQLTASVGDCSATAIVLVRVLDAGFEEVGLRVPNVFSPNGDGVNDVLEVFSTGLSSLDMAIFNRWGQLVYRIERPRQVWDGRSMAGERVPEGTYFYELRAAAFDGRTYELRGTVTVLR